MSSINQVLGTLLQTVENLERAVTDAEKRAARAARAGKSSVPQHDLFGGVAQAPAVNNVYKLDQSQLARKLDQAIEQVEKILQEG